MRDRLIKTIIKRLWRGTLILTAFFFLAGCGGKADEKELEEFTLSGEDTGSTDDSGDGTGDASGEDADEKKTGDGAEPEESARTEIAYVYVCGAVNDPGVYELSTQARVFEAVRAAGGMSEDASAASVNLARTVADGEQIYVPTVEEAQTQGSGVGENVVATGAEQGKVNINTASREELMTLTGIGEAKAESILKYREEHGRFESIEELMEIEGIKEGVFGKIKEDITI